MQLRDDIFLDLPADERWRDKAKITFGVMDRSLSAIQSYLERSPEERQKFWSNRLGADLRDRTTLPNLLLRNALYRNKTGPVLFTSTRIERVFAAADQAGDHESHFPVEAETEIVTGLVAAIKSSNARWSGLDH